MGLVVRQDIFCIIRLSQSRSLLIEWAWRKLSLAWAPLSLARALAISLLSKVHDRASRSLSSPCKQVYCIMNIPACAFVLYGFRKCQVAPVASRSLLSVFPPQLCNANSIQQRITEAGTNFLKVPIIYQAR